MAMRSDKNPNRNRSLRGHPEDIEKQCLFGPIQLLEINAKKFDLNHKVKS